MGGRHSSERLDKRRKVQYVPKTLQSTNYYATNYSAAAIRNEHFANRSAEGNYWRAKGVKNQANKIPEISHFTMPNKHNAQINAKKRSKSSK